MTHSTSETLKTWIRSQFCPPSNFPVASSSFAVTSTWPGRSNLQIRSGSPPPPAPLQGHWPRSCALLSPSSPSTPLHSPFPTPVRSQIRHQDLSGHPHPMPTLPVTHSFLTRFTALSRIWNELTHFLVFSLPLNEGSLTLKKKKSKSSQMEPFVHTHTHTPNKPRLNFSANHSQECDL